MKLKLIYFPVRGRGEVLRYLMYQGGLPFEDDHVAIEKWAEYKPKTIFGAIPMLEVDGKMLAQTVAIGRFLARKANLIPKDDWEAARCDMLVDGTDELWNGMPDINRPLLIENDKEKAMKNYAKWKEERFVPFLKRYTDFLEKNGTGWFVGNQVTWADLFVAEWLDRVKRCYDEKVLDGFPKLQEFCDRVHNLPNLNKYVSARPHMPA